MKLSKEDKEKRLADHLRKYQETYGEHHPICTCTQCLEIRRKEPKLKTLWRLFMFGTKAKAPKVIVPPGDKYTCPECKEDTLIYNEDKGLFICNNEKCKRTFALIKVE